MKPKVLIIVGPTASGKSDLAVELALKFNGEVISADSRQVYKGLDIGTGKITKKEMKGVPHHLLDVASPKRQFTVSQYKKLTEKVLKEILKRKKLPIIVGGTGFYIDAIAGIISFPDVPANPKLRKALSKKTTEELFLILKKKDPRRAKTIDRHNPVRLVRAIEIAEALGCVPLASPSESPYEFVWIGLDLPKQELEKKIEVRLQKRLPGIIREIKRLHTEGLSWKRMHDLGLEYRCASLYVQNELPKKEMIEKLFIEIRQYAKRQRVWFKRNKDIQWFQPTKIEEIKTYLTTIL